MQKLTDLCSLLKTKQFKLVIRELLAVHAAGYLLERINATKITGGEPPPPISPFVPSLFPCPVERGSSCPVMLSLSGWTVSGRKVPIQDTTKQQMCFHLWCYRVSAPRRTSGFGTKSKSSNLTSSLSH